MSKFYISRATIWVRGQGTSIKLEDLGLIPRFHIVKGGIEP